MTMANAVLVVDMLRGFLEKGYPLYCGDSARSIIPNIQRLLAEERAKGSKIFYICDHHAPDDLEARLQALRPEKIIVVGVCTDICVLHTVADARNRDYLVEVPTDCVATFDEEAHRFALNHMKRILGA